MTKPTVPAAVWLPAVEETRAAPAGAIWHRVALQESGHDASRCLATQRAVERLAPLADQRPQVTARASMLYDERCQLLTELGDKAGDAGAQGRSPARVQHPRCQIPVLGDAKLMVLQVAGGQGRIAEGGADSLDDQTVLGLAGEILEGGPDAFLRRRYLYGS